MREVSQAQQQQQQQQQLVTGSYDWYSTREGQNSYTTTPHAYQNVSWPFEWSQTN
jgi:hypothetical protein